MPSRTLAICLTCCLLALCGAAQSAEPIRWGADREGGAPYIFLDEFNPEKILGFEVELAAALAEELGRPIEHTQYPYISLVQGLQRRDIDFAMNGLEVLSDRREKIRFSRPYYVFSLQLTVRAGENRFATLEECKQAGGRVGTLGETTAARLLEQMGVELVTYDSQVEPYEDLKHGRIDAVLLDLPIANYYAHPQEHPEFATPSPPLRAGLYAIALHKENAELAEAVDAALLRLHASGRLRSIYEKWNLWNDDQELLNRDPEELESLILTTRRGWRFADYFRLLLHGAGLTVVLAFAGMALAVVLGLVVAVARLYGPWPVRWLALAYVEFFRGIPVLLLLYFLYYGLPTLSEYYGLPFSLNLPALWAAIIGLGLNYAAYEAEIYRAGIASIPAGQWEAAASLGMSKPLTFRRIILPQAFRTILPPMTGDFVALFKDTSVASVITVVELSKRYQEVAKSSLKYVEVGLVAAALYLIMSIPLGYLGRHLEHRWGKGQ